MSQKNKFTNKLNGVTILCSTILEEGGIDAATNLIRSTIKISKCKRNLKSKIVQVLVDEGTSTIYSLSKDLKDNNFSTSTNRIKEAFTILRNPNKSIK